MPSPRQWHPRRSFQQLGIAVPVLHAPGDPAQCGGGDVCLGNDLVVGLALQQQLGGIDPLRHFFQLLLGAQILKEVPALLYGF